MRDVTVGSLRPDDGSARMPTDPTAPRRIVISTAIAVVVFGSIFAIVRDDAYEKELWPFSAYPMYSRIWRGRNVTRYRLFGVVRGDPDAPEIPLIRRTYFLPIDFSRFYFSLDRIRLKNGGAGLEPAIRDTLERYEARRKAGLHDGPPLRAIRLREQRWRLSASGANRDRPEASRVVLEVASP
jgi:hypothetical protein